MRYGIVCCTSEESGLLYWILATAPVLVYLYTIASGISATCILSWQMSHPREGTCELRTKICATVSHYTANQSERITQVAAGWKEKGFKRPFFLSMAIRSGPSETSV